MAYVVKIIHAALFIVNVIANDCRTANWRADQCPGNNAKFIYNRLYRKTNIVTARDIPPRTEICTIWTWILGLNATLPFWGQNWFVGGEGVEEHIYLWHTSYFQLSGPNLLSVTAILTPFFSSLLPGHSFVPLELFFTPASIVCSAIACEPSWTNLHSLCFSFYFQCFRKQSLHSFHFIHISTLWRTQHAHSISLARA